MPSDGGAPPSRALPLCGDLPPGSADPPVGAQQKEVYRPARLNAGTPASSLHVTNPADAPTLADTAPTPAGTAPTLAGAVPTPAGTAPTPADTLTHAKAQLLLGVPKKIVRRAVDRNQIRRVAREAFRAFLRTLPAPSRANPIIWLARLEASALQPTLHALTNRMRKKRYRESLDTLFGMGRRRLAHGESTGRVDAQRLRGGHG